MDQVLKPAAIKEAAHFRRAIRSYTDQKISDQDLATILEVGRMSPSSKGILDWRIINVKDASLREDLKPHAWGAQKSLPTASDFLIFVARKDVGPDDSLVRETFRQRPGCDNPEKLGELLADHRSFLEHDMQIHDRQGIFEWASKQCYLAFGMMALAASELGIDSCPIEGLNRSQVDQVLLHHNLINPAIEGAVLMMSLGYRDHDPKRPQNRLAMDEFVKTV
ncbi:NAD(P)H-dependent oxidoreductase [Limosilactobacillus gastricus]|nr:NAD(P)H-dependent oxidoreductase [Limosilactobacillus gastricus]